MHNVNATHAIMGVVHRDFGDINFCDTTHNCEIH